MKLVIPERESPALETAVRTRHLVASEVGEIEVRRAIRRVPGAAEPRLDALLAGITQIPVGDEIRARAGRLDPPGLRTLDAIHLATALAVGGLDELIAYDRRLVAAARAHGLPVLSPT